MALRLYSCMEGPEPRFKPDLVPWGTARERRGDFKMHKIAGVDKLTRDQLNTKQTTDKVLFPTSWLTHFEWSDRKRWLFRIPTALREFLKGDWDAFKKPAYPQLPEEFQS